MGPLTVIVWVALTAGRPQPAAVSWTASVPLWTSLSPAGKVVDAGPGPAWASPPPAARLGPLPEMVPAAESAPVPRELPSLESRPILPPGSPAAQLNISPLTVPALLPRAEPVSLPLAIQAMQPRPGLQRPCALTATQVVPAGGMVDPGPAARLGIPSR